MNASKSSIRSAFIIILLALLAAGCTKKEENQPPVRNENVPSPRPSYDFSGSGFKSASVNLEKGKAAVTYAHNDPGNFVVWLTSEDSSDSHLIANEKGPKSEVVTLNIPKNASYILNIQSQGSYSISIRQRGF